MRGVEQETEMGRLRQEEESMVAMPLGIQGQEPLEAVIMLVALAS